MLLCLKLMLPARNLRVFSSKNSMLRVRNTSLLFNIDKRLGKSTLIKIKKIFVC